MRQELSSLLIYRDRELDILLMLTGRQTWFRNEVYLSKVKCCTTTDGIATDGADWDMTFDQMRGYGWILSCNSSRSFTIVLDALPFWHVSKSMRSEATIYLFIGLDWHRHIVLHSVIHRCMRNTAPISWKPKLHNPRQAKELTLTTEASWLENRTVSHSTHGINSVEIVSSAVWLPCLPYLLRPAYFPNSPT